MRNYLLICCLVFIGQSSSIAQSFSEALLSINEKVQGLENISYQINYVAYSQEGVISDLKMKIEKVGNQTYTLMDEVEMYLIDSTQIIVQHKEKSILLNTGLNNLPSQNSLTTQLELIKKLESKAKDVKMEESSSSKIYTLSFSEIEFKEIEIEIDKESGLFKRMRFAPNEPIYNYENSEEAPAIAYELRVSNYNTKLNSLSKPLSEIFDLRDKKYVLKSKYSNYQYDNNYEWQ